MESEHINLTNENIMKILKKLHLKDIIYRDFPLQTFSLFDDLIEEEFEINETDQVKEEAKIAKKESRNLLKKESQNYIKKQSLIRKSNLIDFDIVPSKFFYPQFIIDIFNHCDLNYELLSAEGKCQILNNKYLWIKGYDDIFRFIQDSSYLENQSIKNQEKSFDNLINHINYLKNYAFGGKYEEYPEIILSNKITLNPDDNKKNYTYITVSLYSDNNLNMKNFLKIDKNMNLNCEKTLYLFDIRYSFSYGMIERFYEGVEVYKDFIKYYDNNLTKIQVIFILLNDNDEDISKISNEVEGFKKYSNFNFYMNKGKLEIKICEIESRKSVGDKKKFFENRANSLKSPKIINKVKKD